MHLLFLLLLLLLHKGWLCREQVVHDHDREHQHASPRPSPLGVGRGLTSAEYSWHQLLACSW